MSIEELAEQIGGAVMDTIEYRRRINKGDLVEAAYLVLKRRQDARLNQIAGMIINYRPDGTQPKPSALPRIRCQQGDDVKLLTDEEAAVLGWLRP